MKFIKLKRRDLPNFFCDKPQEIYVKAGDILTVQGDAMGGCTGINLRGLHDTIYVKETPQEIFKMLETEGA